MPENFSSYNILLKTLLNLILVNIIYQAVVPNKQLKNSISINIYNIFLL